MTSTRNPNEGRDHGNVACLRLKDSFPSVGLVVLIHLKHFAIARQLITYHGDSGKAIFLSPLIPAIWGTYNN